MGTPHQKLSLFTSVTVYPITYETNIPGYEHHTSNGRRRVRVGATGVDVDVDHDSDSDSGRRSDDDVGAFDTDNRSAVGSVSSGRRETVVYRRFREVRGD